MRELREDGTLEGLPVYGRIWMAAHEGKVRYSVMTGERHSDVDEVATYTYFRGWASEYLPVKEAQALHKTMANTPVPVDISSKEARVWLRAEGGRKTSKLMADVVQLKALTTPGSQEHTDFETMLNHLDSIHRMLTAP